MLLTLGTIYAQYSSSLKHLDFSMWSQFVSAERLRSYLSSNKTSYESSESLGIIDLLLRNLKLGDESRKQFLTSSCHCRANQKVVLKSNSSDQAIFVVETQGQQLSEWNQIGLRNYRFTCGLYNALRRGYHKRIIGFSLYGRKKVYYMFVKEIALSIKKLYPQWTIRIYHDGSIDQAKICELECLKEFANDTGEYVDNVDFCDVNKLPLDLFDASKTWSAGYLHAMKWRWVSVSALSPHSLTHLLASNPNLLLVSFVDSCRWARASWTTS